MQRHTTNWLLAATLALAPLSAGAVTGKSTGEAAAPRQAYSQSTAAPAGGKSGTDAARAGGEAAPAGERSSRYSDGAAPQTARPAASAVVRPRAAASASHGDYWIYAAGVDLLRDDDFDGFHHRFSVAFDADTSYFSADVYARLYLSFQGGPYYLYHTTDVFTIDGAAGDDDYHVETTLTSGYPPGYYDLAIDLYEAGGGLVASLDAYDDAHLAALPLEDLGYENGGNAALAVFAGVVLRQDDDYDGFHHAFDIDVDVDAPHDTRELYAVIDTRLAGGAWLHEHTTAAFSVHGTGSHDLMRIHAVWESGYPPGYYDFRVRVFDAASGLLQAELGPGAPALAGVPLEDAVADRYHDSPHHTGGSAPGHTVSHEYGGSAGAGWLALAALALAVRRRRRAIGSPR